MDKLEIINPEGLTDTEKNDISPLKRKRTLMIIIIVVSCVVIITVAIVLGVVLGKQKSYDDGRTTPETNFYGCMCDAGSSSTRVSVYTWPQRKKNNIPVLTEVGRSTTNPGMHTMDENQIKDAMENLTNYCRDRIIEISKNHSNVSEANFYLKATAGMRSIPVEEQNKKLDIIRSVIKESELKFLNDSWAKVITGTEEGVFGWIQGNYLNKILFDNQKAEKIVKTPIGSIDLGGYSLEITFTTDEIIKEHKVNLTLSNINYNLYSYSFQDYGQDKFNEALMKSLVDSQGSEETNIIQHPCFLNGYNLSKEFNNKLYTFEGEPNITLCKELIRSHLNINEEKDKSMNDIYQPKIPDNMKFYGISGLFWIADFYKLSGNDYHSPSEFLKPTEEFCNKTWEDAVKEHPKVDKDHLKDYCISGFYVYYFMVDGFKIGKDSKIISYPETIEGVETGWTLGAMSYEIGVEPIKDVKFYIDF